MTDIHCHILPNADDGSKSWDMTLEMCRLARADGIGHIVATPHANATLTIESGTRNPSNSFERKCRRCSSLWDLTFTSHTKIYKTHSIIPSVM
jgi:tyrosine-protein phosphatase YwqE